MPAFAPFQNLPVGAEAPYALPDEAKIESGYVGIVSKGRVYYVAVDDSGAIYLDDRKAQAYCFKTAAALEASFGWLRSFQGSKYRFVSTDGELPPSLKPVVTKGEVRRPAPAKIDDAMIRRILRHSGAIADAAAVAEATDALKDHAEALEKAANDGFGRIAIAREQLEYEVEEKLRELAMLPTQPTP